MNFDVFEYITKVFEYYKSLGVLEFSEITLPGSLPNDPVLTNLWMFDPDDPYNDNHDPTTRSGETRRSLSMTAS